MLISGNTLPVLPLPSGNAADQQPLDQSQSSLQRHNESHQQNRQQTAEYIFRGDYDGYVNNDERANKRYQQQIDPANLSAIFSYTDTQTVSVQRPERQGYLLDIFI